MLGRYCWNLAPVSSICCWVTKPVNNAFSVQKLLYVKQSIDQEQCLHQYAALGDGVALFSVRSNRLVKTMDTKCASRVLADACKPFTTL